MAREANLPPFTAEEVAKKRRLGRDLKLIVKCREETYEKMTWATYALEILAELESPALKILGVPCATGPTPEAPAGGITSDGYDTGAGQPG